MDGAVDPPPLGRNRVPGMAVMCSAVALTAENVEMLQGEEVDPGQDGNRAAHRHVPHKASFTTATSHVLLPPLFLLIERWQTFGSLDGS